MAPDSSGFFFNVEKFFGSISAQRMSFMEKGVYLVMLFQQWREASRNLPDDPQAVADLIAVTPAQAAEVVSSWDVVRRKFVTSEHTPNRIWNVTVEHTRRAQRANSKKRRDAGRAAGKASAAKRQAAKDLPVNERSTTVQRSSTDKRREEESRTDQIREEKNPPPPTARSKRPIFTGQKLTVFEWMLDDLDRLLDPHTEAFDLHDWFFTLDARCVARGEIPPTRDNGEWLKAQTLTEAQRRGLPLRVATLPEQRFGKQSSRLMQGVQNIIREGQR